MALHLVDTNNNDRSAPTPNTKDVLIPDSVKAHNTVSTQYNTDATTQTGFVQQRNMQIIANDGTDNVGLFGFNNALNAWGLFQTKAGTDVTTNTDPSKFIFNSQQDILKVSEVTTLTLAQTSCPNGVNTTITATYNFINTYTTAPIVIGVTTFNGGVTGGIWPGGGGNTIQGNMFPLSMVTSSGVTFQEVGLQSMSVSTTSVTFRLVIANGSGGAVNSPQYTIKAYVLQESAT